MELAGLPHLPPSRDESDTALLRGRIAPMSYCIPERNGPFIFDVLSAPVLQQLAILFVRSADVFE